MGEEHRKGWGKSKMYYCPENKKVWQLDSNNKLLIHYDMPSYGLERKILKT